MLNLLRNTKSYTLTGEKKVNIQVKDGKVHKIDNLKSAVEIEHIENDEFVIKVNEKTHLGEIVSLKQNEVSVMINSNTYHFTIETELGTKRKEKLTKDNGKKVSKTNAPLPGEIVAVLVGEGQEVHKGEPILILEAMKMQNEIISPISGKVKLVHVKPEQTVMKDQALFEIEPAK